MQTKRAATFIGVTCIAAVLAVLTVAVVAVPPATASGAPAPTETGLLRVTTAPPVPSRITVDGNIGDTWGLDWVEVAVGDHEVCFGDVPMHTTPDCDTVTVQAGETTATVGMFTPGGHLRVTTDPPVAARITVDGHPVDNWAASTDRPAGTHEVCFGPVADHDPPPCATVTVPVAATAHLTGDYTPNPGAPGATDVGLLRVTTAPPVPARIVLDGHDADTWGLDWLETTPGDHEVCFGDVEGHGTPPCETVTVTAGETAEVVGTFAPHGTLRVTTDPPAASTISIDGNPANAWGVWTDVPVGDHEVCFGPAPGWEPPPCGTVTVLAGQTTEVTGEPTGGTDPATGPAELHATPGDGVVALEWTDVPGATGHVVEHAADPSGPWTALADTDATTTWLVDDGLTNGTAVSYRVRARHGATPSEPSPVATATPAAGSAPACGTLGADTVWTGTVVLHQCPVTVPDGVTLAIVGDATVAAGNVTVDPGGRLLVASAGDDHPALVDLCDTALPGDPPYGCDQPAPWRPVGTWQIRGTATFHGADVTRSHIGGIAPGVQTIADSRFVDTTLDLRGAVRVTDNTFEGSRTVVADAPAPTVTGNTFIDAVEPDDIDPRQVPALVAQRLGDTARIHGNTTSGDHIQRVVEVTSSQVTGTWTIDPSADAITLVAHLKVVGGGMVVVGAGADLHVGFPGAGEGITVHDTATLLATGTITSVCDTTLVHLVGHYDATYRTLDGCDMTRPYTARPMVTVSDDATALFTGAGVRSIDLYVRQSLGTDPSLSMQHSTVYDTVADFDGTIALVGNTIESSSVRFHATDAVTVTGNTFSDARHVGSDSDPGPAMIVTLVDDVSGITGNRAEGTDIQRVQAVSISGVTGTWNLDAADDMVTHVAGLRVRDGGTLHAGPGALLLLAESELEVANGGTFRATGATVTTVCDTSLVDVTAGMQAGCGPYATKAAIGYSNHSDRSTSRLDIDAALVRGVDLRIHGLTAPEHRRYDVSIASSVVEDADVYVSQPDRLALTGNEFHRSPITVNTVRTVDIDDNTWYDTDLPLRMSDVADVSGFAPTNRTVGTTPTQRTIEVTNAVVGGGWEIAPTDLVETHRLAGVTVPAGTSLTVGAAHLLVDYPIAVHGNATFAGTTMVLKGSIEANGGSTVHVSNATITNQAGTAIRANHGCGLLTPVSSDVTVTGTQFIGGNLAISNCSWDRGNPKPFAVGNTGSVNHSTHLHRCHFPGVPPAIPPDDVYVLKQDVEAGVADQQCPPGYTDQTFLLPH